MKKLIEVTKTDILFGRRGFITLCPIARAVRRATGANNIEVWGKELDINNKRFKLPIEAINFISKYDRGLKTKPFKFRVNT